MQATDATDAPVSALTLKQRVGKLIFPRLPITRFLFDILRDEAAALLVRLQNACVPSRRGRLRRLRAMRDVYVNVACGPQVLDGYVNIDLRSTNPDVLR